MWVGELPMKGATVRSLAFAPDNRVLYTGDTQGHVIAWDLSSRTNQVLFRRPFDAYYRHRRVHWLWPTLDGRLLVQDGHRLIDALHPEAVTVLDPGAGELGAFLYLFPDGRRAAKVDPGDRWRLDWWDLQTGERVPVPGPLGRQEDVAWHALLPDGTLLTCAWRRGDYQVRYDVSLWDLETGERIAEVPMAPVERSPIVGAYEGPCLSPDGRTLVFGHGMALRLFDLPTRSLRGQVETKKRIWRLAFHPNSQWVALVSPATQVALWDLEHGRLMERYDWQCGKVEALAFAPDGQTCVAGGHGKLVVWDVDL